MDEETELKLVLYFTIGYLALFTILAIINRNLEFLFYTVVMSSLIFITLFVHKKLHLHVSVITGLALIGLLHILGGHVYIQGIRLYDFWLIGNFFKYDNFVHLIAIFTTTIIAYSLLNPHLDKKLSHNKFLLTLLLVLIASGIGAFNEILELLAVVLLGAAEGVGNYMNNAIDLVYNLFGAILASAIMIHYHKTNSKNKVSFVSKKNV
mgnify:CR=1 FL=1